MKRSYDMDDTALDNIDMEWKAYFLGLFAADGHCRNTTVKIKLQKADVAILEYLRSCFRITGKLRVDGKYPVLYFSSRNISQQLKLIGYQGKKAARLTQIPNMPNELVRHFIRGYFDGDGCVGNRAARKAQIQLSFCSVSSQFLVSIQEWFRDNNINSKVYKEIRTGKKLISPQGVYSTSFLDMYRLTFTTHEAKLAMIHLCWSYATLYIPRKLQRLIQYIEIQNTFKKNGSYKFNWPEIYEKYINGEEVLELAKRYGFGWRSLYHWMRRKNKPSRTRVIGPSPGNWGEQSPLHAGNP